MGKIIKPMALVFEPMLSGCSDVASTGEEDDACLKIRVRVRGAAMVSVGNIRRWRRRL